MTSKRITDSPSSNRFRISNPDVEMSEQPQSTRLFAPSAESQSRLEHYPRESGPSSPTPAFLPPQRELQQESVASTSREAGMSSRTQAPQPLQQPAWNRIDSKLIDEIVQQHGKRGVGEALAMLSKPVKDGVNVFLGDTGSQAMFSTEFRLIQDRDWRVVIQEPFKDFERLQKWLIEEFEERTPPEVPTQDKAPFETLRIVILKADTWQSHVLTQAVKKISE